jgi:thiamine kinase-like enzyme
LHGDVSCHNLIVQPGPRIRPVDWEWTAIGPAAWDVAKLLDGWPKEQRERLLSAYLDEFDRRAEAPLDRRGFRRDLDHCEVVKKLWYLRWWIRGCEEPAYVDRLLSKMERVWRCLERGDA